MNQRVFRRLFLIGMTLAGMFLISLLGLKELAKSPPVYYSEIIKAESSSDINKRHDQAESLVEELIQFRNDIANEPQWILRLTDNQINAWLSENNLANVIDNFPPEISQPRIRFEPESLKMAFQWDGGLVKSIFSANLNPQMDTSSGYLEVEIVSINAGLIPVPFSKFQNQLTESLEDSGVNCQWVQSEGKKKLRLRVAPRMDRIQIGIEKITILDGEIRINGKSIRDLANKNIDPRHSIPPSPSESIK